MQNLTQLEVAVLTEELNVADGHAYRAWSPSELAVIGSVAEKFRRVDRRDYQRIEQEYFTTFHELGRQTLDTGHFERFPCFTASSGIEIIANYLRLNGLSVTLIEPCFDNLKDILARHGVPLTPFPDEKLAGSLDDLDAFLDTVTTDVIFVVSPNNPTGTTVTSEQLQHLLAFCRSHNKQLIIDTCFRFYLPAEQVYDQYRLLGDSDVDCIVIEDTGKTWPTMEIKAPFLAVSHRLAPTISQINLDFLLHVSPVAISLLTDFLRLSIADGLASVHDVTAANRQLLYAELTGTVLRPVERPFMSMSWLTIDSAMTAGQVTALLRDRDVHALPGGPFFWSDPAVGAGYLRISLSRDTETFRRAASRIGQVGREITEAGPR